MMFLCLRSQQFVQTWCMDTKMSSNLLKQMQIINPFTYITCVIRIYIYMMMTYRSSSRRSSHTARRTKGLRWADDAAAARTNAGFRCWPGPRWPCADDGIADLGLMSTWWPNDIMLKKKLHKVLTYNQVYGKM